ncbi:hypothetical protein MRS44_005584 [Fusarium solani]|uniref:uncharacterized protein n=1 Tax=Fusarium solani TaxID=169388 RepID=UPI0032C40FE9|nr:hypothetical protein MRS44_005584 [Fusarium solani]
MATEFSRNSLPGTEKLSSKWSMTTDLSGANPPVRLEGEIGDVVGHVAIEGHGVVSAFRISNGSVDFKMKYIQTERYLVERKARKSLFGLYKNPWTDHPCVKGVVDSTANTNIVYWVGRLLALRESANPYSVDPDTLQTYEYDPFGKQADSQAPGSPDVVTYAIDKNGVVRHETWVKSPYLTFIHDMALTENWIVLVLWPFEACVDRMKAGGRHFAYNYDLPATFIVIPRRPEKANADWKLGEYRTYNTTNCMIGHTATGWEEDRKIYLECSRSNDNIFPFFPAEDGKKPENTIVDMVVLDIPNVFPRIDERFMSKKYEIIFCCIFYPGYSDNKKLLFSGLNAVAMVNTRTGEKKMYWPGENCYCQEPAFVPRSDDAPEGDGWVMFVVERRDLNVSNLVIVDTRDFETPIAVAELPLRVRPQIHGNWVDARDLNNKPLVAEPGEIKLSGKACNLRIDS